MRIEIPIEGNSTNELIFDNSQCGNEEFLDLLIRDNEKGEVSEIGLVQLSDLVSAVKAFIKYRKEIREFNESKE